MRHRAAALVVLALVAAPAAAGNLDALYRDAGAAYGVDWRLIKAVAVVESSENPKAENRRDPSIGLMQLHCTEDAQGRCINRFDIDGWAGITREQLLDPRTNVRFGTQILAWNLRHFGLRAGIACYNAFTVCRTRQREPFRNAAYVDKVMRIYKAEIAAPADPARRRELKKRDQRQVSPNNSRSTSREPKGRTSPR